MKLRSEFITHQMGGETMLVPLNSASFHGIVRGNQTFGAVLDRLKSETTEDEIVASMAAVYDASKETIASDVHHVIEQLRTIGAIDE